MMHEEFSKILEAEKTADLGIINSLEKQIFDLENLIEVAISLSSNLDFQSLVDSIMYSCIGQLFIEKISIMLQVDIDINSYYIHTAKGFDRNFVTDDIRIAEDSPLVTYLEKHVEPQDFAALAAIPELKDDIAVLAQLEPELIVPMKSKNSLNGIITLGSKIQGGGFDSYEKKFLRGVSRFAATAVHNSRRYQMATQDRMTRLYIHHYFQERLLEELKRSERHCTPLSLFISDIDHFKKFNDTYGHQQGDIVLKETARITKDAVRKIDLPARYGGEEFAVILPDTDIEAALAVAERLRTAIEAREFPGQAEPLHVTVSIGVAQYDPCRDGDKSALIERADKALYKAKESGRNRVIAAE
jgi:diguanylate cyclase (GGDEF)-like protein